MIQSAHQVRIRRPLAEVFEFLQEPDHYAQWQIVMEHISATDGVREGSVTTYTRTSDMGDHVTSIIKITRNNGRDILESVTLGGQFENRVCFRLESDGPAATIFHATIHSKPMLALPTEAESALQYMIETRTAADLLRLQQVLEASGQSDPLNR